ncbi:MAG TPA: hypothetical protein VGN01_07145 [Acidobacteriaceae bacterium]|jgi:hypothetical protein
MSDQEGNLVELTRQISELEGTVIQELVYRFHRKLLEMSFLHWDGRTIRITCTGVLLCNASAVDQSGDDSEVVAAAVGIIQKESVGELAQLGYFWDIKTVSTDQFQYPLVRLRLDGDICVVVVCNQVVFSGSGKD